MGGPARFRVFRVASPTLNPRSPVFIAFRRVLRVLRVKKKVNENISRSWTR
jgi:hypothetical protein